MRIERSLLSISDIVAAYDREMENAPRLLPSDITMAALASRREEAAAWVHTRTGGDFLPSPEDIIPVSKSGQGVRPVAIWDFASRLLYDALVLRLGEALRRPDRTHAAWKAFASQPLDTSGAYIVSSDVTACYDFIDHGLLMEELLVQGGDAAVVENLGSLMSGASRRQYGLPQESWASDLLAEAFLSRLHRVLIRRGLTVSRFSDDFRFTCKSWSDAVRAIELFSEESRRIVV